MTVLSRLYCRGILGRGALQLYVIIHAKVCDVLQVWCKNKTKLYSGNLVYDWQGRYLWNLQCHGIIEYF